MKHSRKTHQNKRRILLALSAAVLSLAGCTPEEKTLLLPMEDFSQEETQEEASEGDFTVKKIYTYTYETRVGLKKSAFLQGCDKNELHVLSLDEDGEFGTLVYRKIDYRYGFYDTIGELLQLWEDWNNPMNTEMELEGEFYIETLLPSPDGTQLLVYLQSVFTNDSMVWLCTLGVAEPRILYEGGMYATSMNGAFSPSGRFVTFDISGESTGPLRPVLIYDCGKAALDTADSASMCQWELKDTVSLFYPPDSILYSSIEDPKLYCKASLYDAPDGMPGLFQMVTAGDANATMVKTFDAISIEASDSRFLQAELENGSTNSCCYNSSILPGYQGMNHLQYQLSPDGSELSYLGNPLQLWFMDLDSNETPREPVLFPNSILTFLQLDSGDVLAAIPQSSQSLPLQTESSEKHPYIDTGWSLIDLQFFWDVQSTDLYLYPAGEQEGSLLYKNLQYLVSMEYDAGNRRILLETAVEGDMSRRRCIILEL